MNHDKYFNYFTIGNKSAPVVFKADSHLFYKGHIEFESEDVPIPLLLAGYQVDKVMDSLKELPTEQHSLVWLRNVISGCIYIRLKSIYSEKDLWIQPSIKNSDTSVPA